MQRAADSYANNRGAYISFQHVPSKTSVKFKAYITAFNETYNSDWASETVFGRIDPIYLFKNTTRKITLGFKLPAASASEAFENLGRVQKLLQFLYPNYTELPDPGGQQSGVFAQTISQSPMIRLKVMNLLADVKGVKDVPTAGEKGKGDFDHHMKPGADVSPGLLGVIDNVTVNHNLEGNDGVLHTSKGIILPKLIDISVSFSPIHEHPIGWSDRKELAHAEFEKGGSITVTQTSQPFNAMFPYGVNLLDGSPVPEVSVIPNPPSPDSSDGTLSLEDRSPLTQGQLAEINQAAGPAGTVSLSTSITQMAKTQAERDEVSAMFDDFKNIMNMTK